MFGVKKADPDAINIKPRRHQTAILVWMVVCWGFCWNFFPSFSIRLWFIYCLMQLNHF